MPPVTAPQVSPRAPMPPPNPVATFSAVSSSSPSCGPYAYKIACAQLYPDRNFSTATSVFVFIFSAFLQRSLDSAYEPANLVPHAPIYCELLLAVGQVF